MNRSKILPLAILLALLLHQWCSKLVMIIPYFVFTILLLNFTAVNIKKLNLLRITKMDVSLLMFQIVMSLAGYLCAKVFNANEIIAQGILATILCPVAASSVVVSCILGANRETVTKYVIYGNLMVAVVAPVIFTFIGVQQEMSFLESFWLVFKRICPMIAFPFFFALFLQICMPKVNEFIARFKEFSFYLWTIALTITLGQTINFIFLHGAENVRSLIILAVISVVICIIQFGLGKLIGSKYGDRVAGGQMLGQKNSAVGVWMANTFLSPLASVSIALYSIWQNLFNSWQLYRLEKKKLPKN